MTPKVGFWALGSQAAKWEEGLGIFRWSSGRTRRSKIRPKAVSPQ